MSANAPPYNFAVAITKSDTDDIALVGADCPIQAVYVGGAGNFVVVWPDNSTTTVTGALAGTILAIGGFKRVNSTNTTASALLALYQV